MNNSAFPKLDGASRSAAEASLEFGRFRVLLRQRQLLADGVPLELGTRAFELLLALLEANGSLVSKEQPLTRVWPGIAVAEDNVKVHVCALRKALGEDRDFIRTEFGRGYRFIAAVHSTVAWSRRQRRCDGSMSQLRSWVLDGPVGDRRMVGRLIALADTLISLGVRALRSAETRLPECREQEGLLMRQCLSGEWSSMMKALVYYKNGGAEVFQRTDVDVPVCGPSQILIKKRVYLSRACDLIAREIMPPQ